MEHEWNIHRIFLCHPVNQQFAIENGQCILDVTAVIFHSNVGFSEGSYG
jgi:hypothetical protein